MVLRELDSYMQKNETQAPTYTIHKNKFKVDKNLNIGYNTIKVLEENLVSKISDITHSNIFTAMSPRQGIKERIMKGDFIKIKSFCMVKKKHQQNEKRTNHMGKYICQ